MQVLLLMQQECPGSAEADDLILLADDSASGAVRSASLVDIPLNVLGTPNASLNIGSQKLTSVAKWYIWYRWC